MNRALPGKWIDGCRDGVPAADLRARGPRAVYGLTLGIAMSAQSRGWDRSEWEALILDDPQSQLGGQIRTPAGKARSRQAVAKFMDDVWERAWERRTSERPWTREDVASEAERRASHAVDVAADGTNNLTVADRDVLTFAASEARRRHLTRVTLPRRALQTALGLGERTVRNSLHRLVEAGHLTLIEHGQPRGGSATRKAKANLFELPAPPIGVPVNGPVGPPALTCGTPASETTGTPASTCGTPDVRGRMTTTTAPVRVLHAGFVRHTPQTPGSGGVSYFRRPARDHNPNIHTLEETG